jgi:predicted ATPase
MAAEPAQRPPPTPRPRAAAGGGWRKRLYRRLADRTLRRRLVLVLVTMAAIGLLAAAKGLIGYYVFAQKSTRYEVALLIVGIVAAAFAVGERRVASALEARFSRNTRKHREGLAALADELATLTDRGEIERRLVARFDALFGTAGTVLYVGDGEHGYAVASHSCVTPPPLLAADDPLVPRLRDQRTPVAPPDVGSAVTAPLAWPLRARGRLIGVLVAGEHDYIESFDPREVEAVTALADAAAANLTLLDPALVAHAPHRTPNNLPPEGGLFVGRESELGLSTALLGSARVLTLTGFGGAGKSRLALRIAEELLAAYPGGVWWVDLAHIGDDAHVAAAVAAAVGVPETRGLTLTDQLVQRFGQRAVLVVLDTCEHVRDGCREVVTGLTRGCRLLGVVATSQSPLGVPDEATLAVGALALPPADATDAATLGRSDAVRLFVDRARRAVPGFAPDAADLAVIAEIVRKLDGIPLAIELAAARVKVLSLTALVDHLAQSLRLLTGGAPGAGRHATMRASLEWSFDHLTADEQALARRLSVFAGGCTLAAAACVANGNDDELALLDTLTALADHSVVAVERDGAHQPRYRLPATMREFAQERLVAAGEADLIALRHRDCFVDLAETLARALRTRDAAGALAALDREFDNLMAAHACSMRDPDGGLPGLRLAQALALFWRDRGLLARGDEVMREALAHAGAQAPSPARAALLVTAARHAHLCGNAADGERRLAEGLTSSRALGLDVLTARALALDGLLRGMRGDVDGGRQALDDAIALARTVHDDGACLFDALDDAADFHRERGALDDAAATVAEALALARAGSDVPALHLALRDAARLAVERRCLDDAAAWLAEALGHAQSSDARFDGENDLEVAGELASARSDWARAARYAGAAAAAAAAMGSARGARDDAVTRADLARAREALGDDAFAEHYAGGQRLRLADAIADARAWLAGT